MFAAVRLSRFALVPFAAIGLALCSQSLAAQTSSVAPRIAGPVEDTSLITLKGNVTAFTRTAADQGEESPSTQLTHMRMLLSRTAEQEAALEQFMAQQLDPGSPNYHKWLTPQQFGALYGPADSDIAAIVAWLESHGFRVDPLDPGKTHITFSGSVRQVEEAFHTPVHSFVNGSQQFVSNTANPQIPAALASVVSGIAHMNTLQPRAHHQPAAPGTYDPGSHKIVPSDAVRAGIRPDFTPSGTGFLYVVPGDAATIYDTPNSLNAAFSGSSSYNGSGVTIGIAGNAAIQASTVVNYRQRFLNDTTAPTITNIDGVAANGDTDEAYIDTELAGGLAPGAAIHFYTDSDLIAAVERAVSDNSVDILSVSFGSCELGMTTADNQMISQEWQQAATQGIAVTVSTGDNGSAGCDDDNSEQLAQYGLQVNGLGSTPYNVAVGGTDYAGLLTGFNTYVSTTNSSNYTSAKGYIPESTWNDSTTTDTTISANVTYFDSSTNKSNIVGGSGGVSACSTNTDTATTTGTCTSGYTKPTWQKGTNVPNDHARDLPDVSLLAGNGFDGAAWLVCTDDTFTQSGTTYTENCAGNSWTAAGFGGTSTSAPAFAGMLAMVQQKVGSRLGISAASNLYALFNGSHASAVFHDVTVGNNSVPCASTPTVSSNCAKNSAGYYFLTGYGTGTGYDLATGLGSVDATQMINFWSSASSTATPVVTVTPSTMTPETTVGFTVAVAITGASGTPTGTVVLSTGSGSTAFNSGTQTLDSTGSFTFHIAPDTLVNGSNTLTVTYSGDSTYSPANGTAVVTATTPNGVATVAVVPSASSITTEQTLTVPVTVTGTNTLGTPTGTVVLSSGKFNSGTQNLTGGTFTFHLAAGTLAAGSDTLTVKYSGDANYASASGTAGVTVTPITPTVTVTPAATSINTGQSLSVSIAVGGTGGTPTGTVTLSSGSYTSSATTLASGAASITIPANSLAAGTDTLTATYSGDSIFAGASATATVTVAQSSQASLMGAYLGTTSNGETFEALILPDNSLYAIYGTTSGNVFNVYGLIRGKGTVSSGTYAASITDYYYTGAIFTGSISATAGTAGNISGTLDDSGIGNLSFSASAIPISQFNFGSPATLQAVAGNWSGQLFGGVAASVDISSSGTFSGSTQGCTFSGTIAPDSSGDNFFDFSITYGASPCIFAGQTQTGIAIEYLLADGVTKQLLAAASSSTGGDVFIALQSATGGSATYSISATTPSAITKGSSATSTITVSTSNGYVGSVALSCALTSSPSGATNVPSCTVSGSPVTLSSSSTTGTATVSVTTTAATAVRADAVRPRGLPGWAGAGGGAALAVLFFFGIPARRRSWRNMLGLLILMIGLGSLSACGGGSSSTTTTTHTPGTTSGAYTFTVTATGTPSVSPAPTTTFTVTVN